MPFGKKSKSLSVTTGQAFLCGASWLLGVTWQSLREDSEGALLSERKGRRMIAEPLAKTAEALRAQSRELRAHGFPWREEEGGNTRGE